MEIKYCTEKFLQDSGLPHVIIRLCGFMQVSVEQTMFLFLCFSLLLLVVVVVVVGVLPA
jgi:hypothetical protein